MSSQISSRKRRYPVPPSTAMKRTRSGARADRVRAPNEHGLYYLDWESAPMVVPSELPGFVPTTCGGVRSPPGLDLSKDVEAKLHDLFDVLAWRWEPLSTDAPKTYNQIHWVTNAHAFAGLFKPLLDTEMVVATNKHHDRDLARLQAIRDALEQEGATRNLYIRFLTWLRVATPRKLCPPFILPEFVETGRDRHNNLVGSYEGGCQARQDASYIGFLRASDDEVEALDGKHLVECDEFIKTGLDNGFFNNAVEGKDANYVAIDRSWHRICAPTNPEAYGKGVSVIFWRKTCESDNVVTSEKIFGGCVYSPEKYHEALDPKNEVNAFDIDMNEEILKSKMNLERTRLATAGKMIKAHGAHSVNSYPYNVEIPEDDEILGKENVRIPNSWADKYAASLREAFMQGFLPELAAKRMAAAKKYNLLNPLHFPETSHFSTIDYCASSHLDDDVCPTLGQCIHRHDKLHRNGNNFFYSRYKLIVESSQSMLWFWDAEDCEHGTTPGEDAIVRHKKYTIPYIRERLVKGIVTRVSTISKAVARAFSD